MRRLCISLLRVRTLGRSATAVASLADAAVALGAAAALLFGGALPCDSLGLAIALLTLSVTNA